MEKRHLEHHGLNRNLKMRLTCLYCCDERTLAEPGRVMMKILSAEECCVRSFLFFMC